MVRYGKIPEFIQRETSSIRNLEWHDFLHRTPLVCIGTAILSLVNTVLAPEHPHLVEALAFRYDPASPWSIFSPGLVGSFFLHQGLNHWRGNFQMLLIFGGMLEREIGRKAIALLLAFTHLAGTFCFLISNMTHPFSLVGASCAVFGVMTFFVLHLTRKGLEFLVQRQVFFFQALIAIVMQFVYVWAFMGADPCDRLPIAFMGHIGGIFGAAVFFYYWDKRVEPALSPKEQLLLAAYDKMWAQIQEAKKYQRF